MESKFGGKPYLVARLALAVYVVYVAACTWAYLLVAPSREAQDVLRFLLEVAGGLPWTLPLLAMPTILGHFDPQLSTGLGFFAIVHALSAFGVAINFVVLNRLCEWGRFVHVRPFEATS